MTALTDQIIDDLRTLATAEPDRRTIAFARAVNWKQPSESEVTDFLTAAVEHFRSAPAPENNAEARPEDPLLSLLLESLALRQRQLDRTSAGVMPPVTAELWGELYRLLGPGSSSRFQILRILATASGRAAAEQWVELLATDPPTGPRQLDVACVPWFQRQQLPLDVLFPRLFDCLGQPVLAAIVLDLANYAVRSGQTSQHPAAARRAELTALLSAMVDRMGRVEEQPAEYASDAGQLQRLVSEGVAVLVSLCDAVGLVGDEAAIGPLNKAAELQHRRVRLEAAGALARLKQDSGFEALVKLAEDPASRTRALEYLSELDQLDRVPEEFRSAEARAEAALCDWLSEPAHFGLAPQELEKVDSRRMYWPGFEEPVECFLFRYEYRLPQGGYTGLGIAGPVVHSLSVDQLDFAPADIYALYAGWHAEHPEMTETAADRLTPADHERWAPIMEQIQGQGFTNLQLAAVCQFFGEEVAVFSARDAEGAAGTVILAGQQGNWLPAGNHARPLQPLEAYWLFKGRRILQTFNADGPPAESEIDDEM